MNEVDLNDCCGREPITIIEKLKDNAGVRFIIQCSKCKKESKSSLVCDRLNFINMNLTKQQCVKHWNGEK